MKRLRWRITIVVERWEPIVQVVLNTEHFLIFVVSVIAISWFRIANDGNITNRDKVSTASYPQRPNGAVLSTPKARLTPRSWRARCQN